MTVGATTVPIFQPTLPMRKATLPPSQQGQPRLISIPTSYAGGDAARSTSHRLRSYFNPHLLCGRRRGKKYFSSPSVVFQSPPPMREATREPFGWRYGSEFQPTLPMRGATLTTSITRYRQGNFNPRSPCGERRIINPTIGDFVDFNPRSPCGERQ